MPRDADATRARILAAAVEEFAASGLAGGRVERIATAAQVNIKSVYQHFGSKEALFDAAVTDALGAVGRSRDPDRAGDCRFSRPGWTP